MTKATSLIPNQSLRTLRPYKEDRGKVKSLKDSDFTTNNPVDITRLTPYQPTSEQPILEQPILSVKSKRLCMPNIHSNSVEFTMPRQTTLTQAWKNIDTTVEEDDGSKHFCKGSTSRAVNQDVSTIPVLSLESYFTDLFGLKRYD